MPTDQARIEFARHFIEGAKEIAETTTVATARIAWNYCSPRLCVCAPRKCDDAELTSQVIYRITAETKKLSSSNLVLIMPLFNDDVTQEPHLQAIWSEASESMAYHRHGSNMIFLPHKREGRESPFVAGCCLLHEMGHELLDLPRRVAGREGLDPLWEEAELHHENYLLWRERGGRRYDQLIKAAIAQIAARWGKTDKKFFVRPESDAPWANSLEKMFGPCASEFRYNRAFHLFIHAHFVLLDCTYKPDLAYAYKLELMRLVHQTYAPHVSAAFPPRLT